MLPDWTVRHASANVTGLFDLDAGELVGQSLREFVDEELLQAVSDAIGYGDVGSAPQRAAVGNIGPLARLCDVSVHVAGGLIHIEIEPQPDRTREPTPTVVAQMMIARVATALDMGDFHQRTADQVRQLTGYDRVMVYRFRHDDAGEVIAESRADDLAESYLGLRYPASDIPPQARALYVRNRLRVIPDAGYVPVPVVPPVAADGQPLDLSQHALRSVASVHLEYLHNMGVAASMSISIISGGRLWGLIACHHRSPRGVPPGTRAAADLFGMFVSMRVSAREQEQALAAEERVRDARDALALRLSAATEVDAVLRDQLESLQRMLPCDGAALWMDGSWSKSGRAPGPLRSRGVLGWLRTRDQTRVAATERAAEWMLGAVDGDDDGLAGVLAIPIGTHDDWLFLFRVEQREEVRWAGDPDKSMQVSDDGRRIAPRQSFATWRETVRGRAVPWSDGDRRSAERLRVLLREQRGRGRAGGSSVADLEAFRRRHVVRDQKSRLDQLSSLLDGLVHLEDHESARLADRIAALEAELRGLMRGENATSPG